MQAMTRSDKKRGGGEWEWEAEGEGGDEQGEPEADHLAALPQRAGATSLTPTAPLSLPLPLPLLGPLRLPLPLLLPLLLGHP